jgi:hypothetical protein
VIDPSVELCEVISEKIEEKELEELETENTKTIESVHDAIANDKSIQKYIEMIRVHELM